jgi:hypothetical protein
MVTQKDFNKKVICLKDHNGFKKGKTYKCTEGMIFSAPENWEVLNYWESSTPLK